LTRDWALLAQYAFSKGVEGGAPIPIEDIIEKHLKLRVEFDDLHGLLGVPRGLGIEPDIFGTIWLETELSPNFGDGKEGGSDLSFRS
jgi:hypothetical protein